MIVQKILRFQIWLVELNPTKGKEINKTRPCVVVSPNEMSALSTVIVAPMTSKGFIMPCRIACEFETKGGFILLDHIRAVDKTRLIKKLGIIDEETQHKICETLQEIFAY